MALRIETLESQVEGNKWVNRTGFRLALTAQGEVVEDTDPRAESLLCGVGGRLSIARARELGLIDAVEEYFGVDGEPSDFGEPAGFMNQRDADEAAFLEGVKEASSAESAALRDENAGLKDYVNQLETAGEAVRQELSAAEGRLAFMDKENAGLAGRVKQLEAENEGLRTERRAMEEQHAALAERCAGLEAQVVDGDIRIAELTAADGVMRADGTAGGVSPETAAAKRKGKTTPVGGSS